MITQPIELFRLLNQHDVRYLVIGGMAAISYGVPRVTKDIDLFIEASPDNCQRLLKAFETAGMGTALLTTWKAVLQNEISIFDDYWRIDVLTRLMSIEFRQAFDQKTLIVRDGVHIPFISLSDLIREKQTVGRPGDIEDAHILQRISDKLFEK